MRIVVIDDTEQQRTFAEYALTLAFEGLVDVESHPPEGYESLDLSDVAVVIVDLMMPIAGWRILEYIAENYPDIYRIAWSAYPELLDDGAYAHQLVAKPGTEELQRLIEALR